MRALVAIPHAPHRRGRGPSRSRVQGERAARVPPRAHPPRALGPSTGAWRASAAGALLWHAEGRDIASSSRRAASRRLATASSARREGGRHDAR
ncbi:hypothetical protein HMPREF1980_00907 [Actinomyces sp. oral taxon 172 str. F0311]|nr:hypothetical protein HMPREF1980_00907 [Actinomyces sp. oral taxon 172 str. F0311]